MADSAGNVAALMRFAAGYGAEMIVWLASFPRSGNTFLRIVLHRLYGVRTSTVYDVDGVAERLGKDLIGFTDRSGSLSDMRAADELHFVKTHRQRDADVKDDDRAICLVRDGRDALVSWARQASEEDPNTYEDETTVKDSASEYGRDRKLGNQRSQLAAAVGAAPCRPAIRGPDP